MKLIYLYYAGITKRALSKLSNKGSSCDRGCKYGVSTREIFCVCDRVIYLCVNCNHVSLYLAGAKNPVLDPHVNADGTVSSPGSLANCIVCVDTIVILCSSFSM